MFILTTISDLVQISPEDLEKPSVEAIEDNINAKYSNKVIQKIGLCICVYDILTASDGLIGHGTGVINVNVEFRLIVFRPFKGEIIMGRVRGSTDLGIRISLEFFEDIWVPSHLLLDNSHFDAEEQTWVWRNDNQDYYYDRNEWIRVCVEAEQWHDLSPVAPAQMGTAAAKPNQKSPYSITGQLRR
ncbi:DNA-directed RNA polymerase III subunit rpc8 [Physcia stellaris]|nr:DNA-directed RNA polymerase III subunit rpc8 [Physcia stellaris]